MANPDARLIGAVHAAAKARGLDDETRRALMARVTGKTSCKGMTAGELGAVLDELNRGGGTGSKGGSRHGPLDGQRAMIRALWISLYHLGVVRDGSDRALDSYVSRQTGIASLRFVQEAKDARSVIEALKDWAAREGVAWDEWPDPRICVVKAQWRRLRALGALSRIPPEADGDALTNWLHRRATPCRKAVEHLSRDEADAAIRKLGAWIRQAMEAGV